MSNIQYAAFSGCENLKNVYYAGSLYDWRNISIISSNDNLIYADKFYNSKFTYSSYINKNGIILVSIFKTDDVTNNFNNVIVASYSSDDSFLNVGQEIQSSDNDYLTYLIDAENVEDIKIFVWNDNMKPVTMCENLLIKY